MSNPSIPPSRTVTLPGFEPESGHNLERGVYQNPGEASQPTRKKQRRGVAGTIDAHPRWQNRKLSVTWCFCVDGKQVSAHRYAWVLANGEIPAGLFVCHKCDVPACCRPSHMFLGTNEENLADMTAKGRRSIGRKPNVNVAVTQ